MSQKIRTRYAPSPTGRMHVGNLRTALYAYLIAKHEGGDFILRIEDTDQERYVEGAVDIIYRTLEKTGLVHDEGPDKDGGVGPYVQSERQKQGLYLEYAKQLIEKGQAYYCFCDKERLATLTCTVAGKEINVYDKHCLHLSKEEVEQKLAAGVPYVIRQNNPTEGTTTFHDDIYGDITVDNSELDDMILIKSDGYPTYNFANVVDDHLMGTTDVIRADEWIASIPLHVEMFELLGFPVPRYTHLSPIMKNEAKEDGGGVSRRKLSKRKDPEARVGYYDEAGYPVAAVLDYLLTIGSADYEPWREEHMDASIYDFRLDLSKTGAAGALFDFDKLNNVAKKRVGHMSEEQIFDAVSAWAGRYDAKLNRFIRSSGDTFRRSIAVWHERRLDVAKWSDLMELYPYLYDPGFTVDAGAVPQAFLPHKERIPAILTDYLEGFDYEDGSDVWFAKVKEVAARHNYCVKMGAYKKHPEDYNGSIADLSSFIRYALTGTTNTPDLHGIIHVIGKEAAVGRINDFLSKLK